VDDDDVVDDGGPVTAGRTDTLTAPPSLNTIDNHNDPFTDSL